MELSVDMALLRRLNLNHLVGFLAIAEVQSFRGAADHLHISQSALSVQIRQLEETLGVPLFHRTTRSVTPTDEGQRLLPVARLLAQEVTLVASDFREEAALHRGIATLAAVPSVASDIVPTVLKSLANVYPGIKIQFCVKETSIDVADVVQKGEVDMGVLNFSGEPKDLTVTKLFEDEIVAIVPASDLKLSKLTQITLRQLCEFPLLIQPRGSLLREILEAQLLAQGVTADVRYELHHANVLVALVSQGLGVSVVPLGGLALLNLRGCRTIKLRVPIIRSVGLVTSTRRSLSPSAELLRQFIIDASRQPPMAHHRRA